MRGDVTMKDAELEALQARFTAEMGASIDLLDREHMTNVAAETAVPQDAGDVTMCREERETPRVVAVGPLFA